MEAFAAVLEWLHLRAAPHSGVLMGGSRNGCKGACSCSRPRFIAARLCRRALLWARQSAAGRGRCRSPRARTWARCAPTRPTADRPTRRGDPTAQSRAPGRRVRTSACHRTAAPERPGRAGAPSHGGTRAVRARRRDRTAASERWSVPPHDAAERWGASACHRAVAGTARWHIRRRDGPHGGASERPARGARLGTNRAPARPPQAGEFTVARTCVLIKTASHPACTCVLITCMSQARYGPWPRSDVMPWCRQNGCGSLSGTAGHPVSCHDRIGGAAASCPGGAAWHPPTGGAWRPRREALRQRCGRALGHLSAGALRHPAGEPLRHPAGGTLRYRCGGSPRRADSSRSGGRSDRAWLPTRVGAPAAGPRLSRSLLAPQGRERAAAGGGARPRRTNARAPC